MTTLPPLGPLSVDQTESMLQVRVDPFEDAPDLDAQLAALRLARSGARPWVAPSIREALGVPAIQRAVTLISNAVGSLTMEGWRNGVVMAESPRLLARPNPFETPRDSYRDMAYQMATRGETVLWVASRDGTGAVTAVVVVPPAELNVEDNPRNRLFPIYTWGTRRSTRWSPVNPDGDFIHITYLREPGALRGMGPLQMAGAAVSVSVEAQEWAANFYAGGGAPSVNLHTEVELTEAEAAAAKLQWMETPPNMPKVTSGLWELRDVPYNAQGAQMLDAREYQNGDAARLFGIPGALMEYGAPGSSLTYQNLADVWINFVRGSLSLNYLEPIEQAFTDLMPRTTTARFNVQGLQRADEEARWRIYQTAVSVIGPEEAGQMARQREGLIPGDPEMAPVPFAPPAAVPVALPQLRSAQVRCSGQHPRRRNERCNALLAEEPPFTGRCWRCGMPHLEVAPVAADDGRLRRLEEVVTLLAARSQEPSSVQVSVPAADMTPIADAIRAIQPPPPAPIHIENKIPGEKGLLDEGGPVAEALVAIAATQQTVVDNVIALRNKPPTRKVVERNKAGQIIGMHEEESA